MQNIKSFHPGVYIKESLEAMNLSLEEFSKHTGILKKDLDLIINEQADVTNSIAYKLADFFDNSINFWINLQNQYNTYTNSKNL